VSDSLPSSPVNRAILDEYVDVIGANGKKSLIKLIDIYLRTSPNLLAAMDNALKKGDLPGLKQAVHTLKSSSGSLGAAHLFELCQDLEMKAGSDFNESEPTRDLEAYRRDTLEIRAEFTRVNQALGLIREEMAAG
jgi:HPt (histidine-containing phosphotransfer) domain-containing protein